MKNFFEDYIIYVLIIIIVVVVIFVLIVGINDNNQSVHIDNARFTWTIIQLGNGELIEGEITSWRDYDKSDMIQVTINNDLTILTHSSNILLCSHNP